MTGSRRLLAGVAVLSSILLVGGCGSSGHTVSDSAGTPSSTTMPPPSHTAVPITPPTTVPAASTSAAPSTPAASTSATADATSAVAGSCAALATHTFLHITAVQAATDGSLTLTGNPATLVCGGPDDSHFNTATSTVTAHVIPGASIMVFPVSKMHPEPIAADKLAAYLASDYDTRTFLVTGSLSAISGLQEQFHP